MSGTDKSDDDSAIGCLTVIAAGLITIGAAYAWGPIALVIIGAVILMLVVLQRRP